MPSEIAVLRAALKSSPEHHARLRRLCESGAIGPMVDIPDDEPLTIVAAPDHYGIDGAKQAQCGCGIIVWMTPLTLTMLLKRGTAPHRVLCPLCFIKELKEDHAQARPQ